MAAIAQQWKEAARTYFKTHKRKRVVNGWTHYKMQNFENTIKRIIVELQANNETIEANRAQALLDQLLYSRSNRFADLFDDHAMSS